MVIVYCQIRVGDRVQVEDILDSSNAKASGSVRFIGEVDFDHGDHRLGNSKNHCNTYAKPSGPRTLRVVVVLVVVWGSILSE